MSSQLVILGRLADRTAESAIVSVTERLGMIGRLNDAYPSIRPVVDAVSEPGDLIVQVDAPESGTAVELEDEVGGLGEGSRLIRLLRALTGLNVSDIRLLWSWDDPDIASLRHREGSIADLVQLLGRPESWGEAEQRGPNLYHVSYDSPLLFTLQPAPASRHESDTK